MDATQTSQQAPRTVQRKAKHTILFLAANPFDTDRLALDREARAIEEEIERCGYRDSFEFATRWAVSPMDLLRELRKLKPTVVHFSGYSGNARSREGADLHRDAGMATGDLVSAEREGLYFHGPEGRPLLLPTAALAETFRAAGASVRLVVLSACYSEAQANALVAHVACVVGMRGSIRDTTARAFAIGFYGGLGEGEPVAAAFRQGMAAIHLYEPADHSSLRDGGASAAVEPMISPMLLTSPGIDPNDLYIVEQPRQKMRCSITIRAELVDFDAEVIARVRNELRWLTGDVLLEIIEVKEGSVRLIVVMSVSAASHLRELSDGGQLSNVCGFAISALSLAGIAGSGIAGEVKRISEVPKWFHLGAHVIKWRNRGRLRADPREHRKQIVQRVGADFAAAGLAGADFSMVNLRRANFLAADLRGARLCKAMLTSAMLNKANLEGANLEGANLEGANLVGANLEKANLSGANLSGANLALANLREVRPDFIGARLIGGFPRASLIAEFTGAKLSGANLSGAKLTDANLAEVELAEANLAGADLVGANLARANLARADLVGANLARANLARAELVGTNLAMANLSGAELFGANLSEANLSGANLSGANLSGANLSGAKLDKANLEGASLERAFFYGTALTEAKLSRAILKRAKLGMANLNGADLEGAYLEEADLDRADLTEANLNSADLSRANLAEADLGRADLEEADLGRADLNRANLNRANLSRANLARAKLAGSNLAEANLAEADLAEADLAEADLAGANLAEANLAGANLAGANLAGANLAGAHYNETTHWPQGFVPPTVSAKESKNVD